MTSSAVIRRVGTATTDEAKQRLAAARAVRRWLCTSREAVEAAFFDPAGLDAMAQAGTDLSSMRVHDVDEPLREHAKVATSRLAATQCRRFDKMPPPWVETSQSRASTTRIHSQPTTPCPFVFQRIT